LSLLGFDVAKIRKMVGICKRNGEVFFVERSFTNENEQLLPMLVTAAVTDFL